MSTRDPIYLDYNATTPLAPEAAAAMMPLLHQTWANPTSPHTLGQAARQVIEGAREEVASLLDCSSGEVIFTSGGTEADVWAIRGITDACCGGHVLISAIEHPAVSAPARALAAAGRIELETIPVDSRGRVDADDVAARIRPETILVSVMLANNEVGTLQPIAEIAAICRERGITSHSDAAQAISKIPVSFAELGCDLLTVAAHKMYGPKGFGALIIREGCEISPLLPGAGHQRGLRAGTECAMLAAGFGAAATLARHRVEADAAAVETLRDHLESSLLDRIDECVIHARGARRLPNTCSVAIPGLETSRVVDELGELLACSAGAACKSGKERRPSAVLTAMGVDPALALSTIRLSLGRSTSLNELDEAIDLLASLL